MMREKESHILCDEIYFRVIALNTTVKAIAKFCDVNACSIGNIRNGRQLAFSIESMDKLKAGLKRLDNGEPLPRIKQKDKKSKYIEGFRNQEKERAQLEDRKLDGERRKQSIIRKAKIAELARYGKTTIGDEHITDGIA